MHKINNNTRNILSLLETGLKSFLGSIFGWAQPQIFVIYVVIILFLQHKRDNRNQVGSLGSHICWQTNQTAPFPQEQTPGQLKQPSKAEWLRSHFNKPPSCHPGVRGGASGKREGSVGDGGVCVGEDEGSLPRPLRRHPHISMRIHFNRGDKN